MSVAVVFPGQGSQSTGMLAGLAAEYPVIGETFSECADVLGTDLWALAQTGPDAALSDTRVTQPLMFTSGVAVWRVLQQAGLAAPAALAGHSLGEFAALVAADSLSFTDALGLVKRRSMLMAEAVPEGEGGMAALIGMDDEAVIALCEKITGARIVEAVNFNAPGQVAISGHLDALEQVVAVAREHGARKAIMLAVSVPNHSSLMRTAGAALATSIDALEFQEPRLPLLQNATARPADSLSSMLDTLKTHVHNPVRWTQTIQALRDSYGVNTIIEAGPGKVLTGLCKRIDRTLQGICVDSPESLEQALNSSSR